MEIEKCTNYSYLTMVTFHKILNKLNNFHNANGCDNEIDHDVTLELSH